MAPVFCGLFTALRKGWFPCKKAFNITISTSVIYKLSLIKYTMNIKNNFEVKNLIITFATSKFGLFV